MSILRKVAKNALVILLAKAIEAGSSFIIMMILCRYFRPAMYGDYAFVNAIILAFQPLVNMELNTILVREIARNPSRQNELISAGILLKNLLITIFIVSVVSLSAMLDLPSVLKLALFIAAAAEIFQQIFWVFNTMFMAHERMAYETLSTIVYRIFTVGGICIVALPNLHSGASNQGFLIIFWLLCTGHLIRAMFSFWIGRDRFNMKSFRFQPAAMKELIGQSWIMGVATFCTGLSLRVDIYILRAFKGSEAAGVFHLPHMIVLQFQIVALALVTALFPMFSRLGGDGHPEIQFRQVRDIAIRLLTATGLWLALFLVLFPQPIIMVLGGSNFILSQNLLVILAWCVPILFLNFLCSNLLTALKEQNKLIVGAVVSLVFNIFLDLIWVPRYGASGAAWATIISYSVQLIIAFGYLQTRERVSLDLFRSVLLPGALTAGLAGICIMAAPEGLAGYLIRSGVFLMTGVMLYQFQTAQSKAWISAHFLRRFRGPRPDSHDPEL